MSWVLTSAVPVAQVRETPYISYTNGVPQAGEDELCLAAPIPTV
jgi:hypothetical protein